MFNTMMPPVDGCLRGFMKAGVGRSRSLGVSAGLGSPLCRQIGNRSYSNDDTVTTNTKRSRDYFTKMAVSSSTGIREFAGRRDPLSNFYPCDLRVYGTRFRSTEHAYQWRKAICLNRFVAAKEIFAADHAGKAKQLARQHTGGVDLSSWTPRRVSVMKQLIRAKARCCKEFVDELRNSGDRYIAEAVPRASYWGIDDGTGENVMGNLLMDLRSNLHEALNAEPTEDGKLTDFPVLIIGDKQLEDIDCGSVIADIRFKKVIVTSVEEARDFMQSVNTARYMAAVFHLLSRDAVSSDPDNTLTLLSRLVRETEEKMKCCHVIVSLAIYPAFSHGEQYCRQARYLNSGLYRQFDGVKYVHCLRNYFKLSFGECFTSDQTLTSKATGILKDQLVKALSYYLHQ